MKKITSTALSWLLCCLGVGAQAQSEVEMADTLRSEGKIYVVVAILLLIFAGLISYLVMLDRKLTKLEGNKSDKKS